jgi:UDP-N-acetylmuramate dehydrogenase
MPLYPAAEEGKAKLAAGWLIDRAGWKGKSDGRVGVHARQASVLINLGGATGAEVMATARRIVSDVKERFGVELSPEVNVL